MAHKQAETRVRWMSNWYRYYAHKYGDVRYPVCANCHTQFTICPVCKQKWVLPKSENAPDFAVGMVYTYIEAKNNDKTGRWGWTEISETGDRANQRKWLLDKQGWLFIELGLGRAPKGKGAWLIPFVRWVQDIEPKLDMLGMKSIRKETKGKRPGADELLAGYQLEWHSGGWVIPDHHAWWHRLHDVYGAHMIVLEGHIHEE